MRELDYNEVAGLVGEGGTMLGTTNKGDPWHFPLRGADGAIDLQGPLFERISIGLLNHAKADPDLDSVRNDPRFQAMVATAEARLGAASERDD